MEDQATHTEEAQEVALEFKRFSKEKQDQIRALVNYATLMGLDGKDLVSIGGRLTRVKENREKETNRKIIEGMDIRPIGKDNDCYRRWAYSQNGVTYHFTESSYDYSKITNTKTNKSMRVSATDRYPFGDRYHYKRNWELPNIMLNVYYGNITLP